ncbi:transposase [Streptomyces sp. NPDC005799]|uniref:transposase n=1 Tax=Streptomyces sp. NPDC005799 TaxID=3154678 RepID=UPI0034028734
MLPSFTPRRQGGGTAPLDKRAVFTAVVYVLSSGYAWRHLPPTFGVSPATAHRRFSAWTKGGCSVGCTGRCWTSSARVGSWTGRQ